jgi:cytochrome b subunit of formate dehydrogenase
MEEYCEFEATLGERNFLCWKKKKFFEKNDMKRMMMAGAM